jgi:hypothetical protein
VDQTGKLPVKETKCMFFLQLVDNDKVWPEGTWEEVSEYIYENHHKVFLEDNRKRYNGNKAHRSSNGGISITANNMTDRDYAILMRMFGVNINVSNMTGYLKKPEYLKVKGRKSTVLHEVATGQNYAMKIMKEEGKSDGSEQN